MSMECNIYLGPVIKVPDNDPNIHEFLEDLEEVFYGLDYDCLKGEIIILPNRKWSLVRNIDPEDHTFLSINDIDTEKEINTFKKEFKEHIDKLKLKYGDVIKFDYMFLYYYE